jgi:HK97 family phage major capsid protein
MSPRVKPKQDQNGYRARLARKEAIDSAEAWAELGIAPTDKATQDVWHREESVYAPDSSYSYFADFVAVSLEDQNPARSERGERTIAPPLSIDLDAARKRLATVQEQRDVSSGDPGAASFLGPGYLGAEFNLAARAEASLANALGLRPLPPRSKRVDIPRLDTGASAAVQNPEGSAVSQTDVDSGSQAGNIATIAGRQTFSLQAFEWGDPAADEVIARELGRAIGQELDKQLVAGSNASGQTLGLANVTGIKTVTWTDASPTSQEAVGQLWKSYNEIASLGQGVADPNRYINVVHPRRLAWLYHNPQASQSIIPAVPGRLVASAGLRTTLGGGTEDEMYLILGDELPVYASPVRLLVDAESASSTMQVKLVAYQMVGTGFGRAPQAICRVSGTGLVAPAL